jgi:hexosaminidase
MNINLTGDTKNLIAGLKSLTGDYGFSLSPDGIPLAIEKRAGDIEISLKNGRGTIKYEKKTHFFRAFGLFLEHCQNRDEFELTETPQFSMNGIMFDCSRNGVMTVDTIKKMLRTMAVMGLNMMMLYTEDTYSVDGQPYFGYMRGRYSFDELKACDDYADTFGIEIIPCIQTLAHLGSFLRWNDVVELRDTPGILLAGNEKTYDFLDSCIRAASAPFRSKRIHIGMDEAHGLGLGRYISINGYREGYKILSDHLKRVTEITKKYGLRPMIWDDMYFKMGSKKGEYYDLESEIPQELIDDIPEGIQMVYWDYYNHDEEFYSEFIKKHKVFGQIPVFAGGIHIWHGMGTDYGRTFVDTNAALAACKKTGVKEVFATAWNNDGSENNCFSTLLGLQLFAEHGYSFEVDMEKLKKRARFCAGADFDAFMDLKLLNKIPGADAENLKTINAAKFLLWQDILIDLFHTYATDTALCSHYEQLETKFTAYAQNEKTGFVFEVPTKLCAVLKVKCNIGNRIKAAYDKGSLEELKSIAATELPELLADIKALRETHRQQWFAIYKPFGWEVLDIRYGGLIARVETAIVRLTDYINGKIDSISELEEERIDFNTSELQRGEVSSRFCNSYQMIATANRL